jgi:hypothetical protein
MQYALTSSFSARIETLEGKRLAIDSSYVPLVRKAGRWNSR